VSDTNLVEWHIVIKCSEEMRREVKSLAAKSGMRIPDFISMIVIGRVADILGGAPTLKILEEERSARERSKATSRWYDS